ncbi:uncharacterized protein BDR25DRAFT_363918 [Lindgomyces ingoldianus]|uniref:Uncharacterized protein n=1 Tax=Lindgomyces ingoldianus TaxID=673940 RepID=A0ACB6Q8U5_9PLEO|nr:uncharacterized protein BDR25DRAFT_363918 [Lindgomyces ingoldianus]KAF2462562.1 hypothetical protein BDR25DRAFT_363918 [Lindgomyces ingoldianus]
MSDLQHYLVLRRHGQRTLTIGQSCCRSDYDALSIGNRSQYICNEAWREQSKKPGDMAMDDWVDRILPFNWTVRADNSSRTVTKPSKCHSQSYYLLYIAVGSIVLAPAIPRVPALKIYWQYLNPDMEDQADNGSKGTWISRQKLRFSGIMRHQIILISAGSRCLESFWVLSKNGLFTHTAAPIGLKLWKILLNIRL